MDYDDCPTVCGNGEEIEKGVCEDCPVKQAEENFRNYAEERLETVCQGKWQKYGFDLLKKTVEAVAEYEDTPESERSLKTHRLVQVFQSSRNRFQKIIRENEKEQKPE